ncbi:MAG TPA: enoyl-CoA hydratase/isomerase family protein [Nevskia sp.]|nr:enoyl-CoA hydratase/isomerase family protein [Nevskia sp.]
MSDELQLARLNGVCTVTLNRPESLNAAGPAMLFALAGLMEQLAADESAALIVTGAGRAFSAGGDFQHFVKTSRDADYARATLANARRFIAAMLALPMPVIAAVNGPAVGFGATLAALSDLVLISDRAYLAEPHINVGLVLGDGIAVTWPLMMSLLKAKEYILTGRRITPEQAVDCGLANRVVPHEQLLDEAHTLAAELATQPRTALRQTKALLNLYVRRNMETVLDELLQRQFEQTQGPEHGAIVRRLAAKQAQKRATEHRA